MPIKPENRKRYAKNWKLISSYIRQVRALDRCEVCGVLNHSDIVRGPSGDWFYHECTNTGGDCYLTEDGYRHTTIVLTVAHLNDTPEDNRPENLKAMCQKCHLSYDMQIHIANRRETLRKRQGLQELFEVSEIQKSPYRNTQTINHQ